MAQSSADDCGGLSLPAGNAPSRNGAVGVGDDARGKVLHLAMHFTSRRGAPGMGLPCVTVTDLILPFPQLPSSTRTVVPLLRSIGSCLTTTWALAPTLAATNKTDAATMMRVVMSMALDKPICQSRGDRLSFNDAVGAAEHRERKRDAERACGLEIDFHLDLRDLLHRQVGRQFALEDAAGVHADPATRVEIIGAITHETAASVNSP